MPFPLLDLPLVLVVPLKLLTITFDLVLERQRIVEQCFMASLIAHLSLLTHSFNII